MKLKIDALYFNYILRWRAVVPNIALQVSFQSLALAVPLDSDCGNIIPVTVTVSLRRLEAFTWLKPSKCDISEQKPSRSQRGKTREAPSETLLVW